MVAIPDPKPQTAIAPTITWEPLPAGYVLEDEPVENTGQPLLAGALRESLELAGWIQPPMLIASNFGICATVNGELVIKAPDWVYVPQVQTVAPDLTRKSYTPNLDGAVPSVVMEFLSDAEGGEYSVKRTPPLGKWFFYEQILKIPVYVIFDPAIGLVEVYRLQGDRYTLEQPDELRRHWLTEMDLFLGTWRGEKEGRDGYWLRWWTAAGELLLWGAEKVAQTEAQLEAERQRAEIERQRAEAERQRAEAERQRAEKLAALLRSQGINPDELV